YLFQYIAIMSQHNVQSPTPSAIAGPSVPDEPSRPSMQVVAVDDVSKGGALRIRVVPYTGTTKGLKPFLAQLKTHFRLNPKDFAKEWDKVLYSSVYLRDGAFRWFKPY